MTTKESDLKELEKTYRENLGYHKKQQKELDEKLKNAKERVIALQG